MAARPALRDECLWSSKPSENANSMVMMFYLQHVADPRMLLSKIESVSLFIDWAPTADECTDDFIIDNMPTSHKRQILANHNNNLSASYHIEYVTADSADIEACNFSKVSEWETRIPGSLLPALCDQTRAIKREQGRNTYRLEISRLFFRPEEPLLTALANYRFVVRVRDAELGPILVNTFRCNMFDLYWTLSRWPAEVQRIARLCQVYQEDKVVLWRHIHHRYDELQRIAGFHSLMEFVEPPDMVTRVIFQFASADHAQSTRIYWSDQKPTLVKKPVKFQPGYLYVTRLKAIATKLKTPAIFGVHMPHDLTNLISAYAVPTDCDRQYEVWRPKLYKAGMSLSMTDDHYLSWYDQDCAKNSVESVHSVTKDTRFKQPVMKMARPLLTGMNLYLVLEYKDESSRATSICAVSSMPFVKTKFCHGHYTVAHDAGHGSETYTTHRLMSTRSILAPMYL
jgi:hypothetical protein